MKERTIILKDSHDIEKITSESIIPDAITATRYNDIKSLIDVLTSEKKAIEQALFEKYGHETFKNDMLSISVYDSFDFNKDEYIDEFGEDEYKRFKTKRKHTERLVRFGK